MKRYSKVIALVLTLVMMTVTFFGCKETPVEKSVGIVDGVKISDGVFINCFFNALNEESAKEDWPKEFAELYGQKLYDALVAKKKGDKSYFDIVLDNALEESRLFMIKHKIFSSKEGWPNEDKQKELKTNAESYIEQMYLYYGSSFGAKDAKEFVQAAYGMSYDELLNYFFMSACIETYKQSLEESVSISDEELLEYYKTNISKLRTVEVRHSLLKVEKSEDKEKILAEAQALVDKYNAGEITFDDIMKESDDVDSENKPNNDGYYIVYEGANFVEAFKEWGIKQTEASNKIEIVETEYGYHIMMCTKVLDTTDKDVKDRTQAAYMDENVNQKFEEEVNKYKEDKKYKIENYNKEYAVELAKKAIVGEENSESEATATASAAASAPATATPTQVAEDAAQDKTVVAVYKGTPVYKAYYAQFFSQAMNNSLADYDFSALSEIEDEKEYYAELKKIFDKEYKDGKSYIEYSKEEAFSLMLKFLAAKDMAIAAEKGYSDEKVEELIAELDSQIDSMLSYYGESYGAKTRDELMQQIAGMNVNDYKSFYVDQMLVSEYSKNIIENIKSEDSFLTDFYKKDPDAYRIVTIRVISKSLLDSDKKEVSAEKKAEILELMKILEEKVKNGDSGDALFVGYSDSTDSAKGLKDLTKATTASVDSDIAKWAFEQTEVGAVKIIENKDSYDLVIIEGLTDYNESKGITAGETVSEETVREQVKTEYKNHAYDDQVDKYIKDNNLAFTDKNNNVVNDVVEKYLSFEESEETDKSDESENADKTE